jgi:hypothetical protein
MRRTPFDASMLARWSLSILLVVLASMVLSPSAGAASRAAVATPKIIGSTAGVGVVTVSWKALSGTGITYTVTSQPAGLGCRIVDAASCTFPDTDSVSRRFQVTASSPIGVSLPSKNTKPLKHRLVLIVLGQSNAMGAFSFAVDPASGIDYLRPPYSNTADKKSLITWAPLWLYPQPTPSPVVLDSPQISDIATPVQIFGPEIGIARKVWTDIQQPVTIVKVTYPGSDLAIDWQPNGDLFNDLVNKVRSAMALDAASRTLDTIGAVYMYQGEADADIPTEASAYQSNLSAFIATLRSQLPEAQTTPFALVKESLNAEIAQEQSTGTCPPDNCASQILGNVEVRSADDWASSHLPNVVEVDSLGLPRYSDYVHLTNVAELTLGNELATVTDRSFP